MVSGFSPPSIHDARRVGRVRHAPWRAPGAGQRRPLRPTASRQPGDPQVRADETLEQAALNLYERLGDSRLSFTDCVNFAVMHGLDIPIAFAFDRHFERAGFRRLRQRDL
jgi:hypothetical protein